ncbi:MAG: AAA family ATPase [Candidatus Diapherotrites archaeon]
MPLYRIPKHFSQKKLKERKLELKEKEAKIKQRYANAVARIPHYRLVEGFYEVKRMIENIKGDTVIVAVCGPMGSGKSSFTSRLANEFNGAVISTDLYFKEPQIAEKFPFYYDDPRAVNLDLLAEHLKDWRQGKSILMPVHDLITHKTLEPKYVPHTRVLFVEGTMAFHPKIRKLVDIKVYLESAPNKRLKRRYKRDVHMRGRTIAYVRDRFYSTLEPARIALLEQWKHHADIIIIT